MVTGIHFKLIIPYLVDWKRTVNLVELYRFRTWSFKVMLVWDLIFSLLGKNLTKFTAPGESYSWSCKLIVQTKSQEKQLKCLLCSLISLSEQPYKIGIITHHKLLLQLRQGGGREVEKLKITQVLFDSAGKSTQVFLTPQPVPFSLPRCIQQPFISLFIN